MLALMRAHVDKLRRSPHRTDGRTNNLLRRRYKSDYRSVVIGIDVGIEHTRGLNSSDSLSNPPDRVGISSFAEVWNTFHQGLHRLNDSNHKDTKAPKKVSCNSVESCIVC